MDDTILMVMMWVGAGLMITFTFALALTETTQVIKGPVLNEETGEYEEKFKEVPYYPYEQLMLGMFVLGIIILAIGFGGLIIYE